MPPKSQSTAKIREDVVRVNGCYYPRFITDLGTVAGKRIRGNGSTIEEVKEKLTA